METQTISWWSEFAYIFYCYAAGIGIIVAAVALLLIAVSFFVEPALEQWKEARRTHNMEFEQQTERRLEQLEKKVKP